MPTASLTVNNWPDAAAISGGEIGVAQVADGVQLGTSADLSASGPTGPYTSTVYPNYGDALQGETYAYAFPSTGMSVTDIATRSGLDAGLAAIDMSQALPLLDSASLDSSNAAQPALTFGSDAGSLASADGSIVYITWRGTDDAGQPVQSSWTILAPPSATTVRAPALPVAAAAWAPPAGSSFGSPIVAVVEASFIAGYARLRAQATVLPLQASLVSGYPHQALAPALPADGTLRLTAYTVNGD